MKENPYRQDKEELKELLRQYNNLREGRSHSFIDEDSFERIINYFDDKEELSAAIEAANYAVELYPFSSMLLLKKADLLIAARHYGQALEILEKAELLDPSDINLYILKTDVYLALDRQQQAAEILEEGITVFDGEERIELLFELADVYDDYEDFDKVFNCLKLILEEEPNNEEALYKICFWTDYTNRNEESIHLHMQIIEEFPFNELAWFNLGAAYQGLKLYEKAIDAYQYAIAIDEKFDYAYRNLGDAYIRIHKYKDAIESLHKVLELSRPEDVIYEAIGHCYEKMKNYAQARQFYRKTSHLIPEDTHIYYKIALTYIHERQWESAIKNLETAMRIDKSQPEYHFAIAKCYSELKKVKEAVIHFSAFIKKRPKSPKGWKELLRCLYQQEFYTDALEQVDNAMMVTSDKPLFYYYKSAILFALGKQKEALLVLERALSIAPGQVKHLFELNNSLLQSQKIVRLISRYKGKKN